MEGRWIRQPSGSLAWLHDVHFVDENRGWAVGGSGVLLSTINGGRSWQVAAQRPTEDTIRDFEFIDATNGWMLCERSIHALIASDEPRRSYLLRTMDGGQKWQRANVTGLDAEISLTRVVFADLQHGWVFGDMGTLYATRDGGATWTKQLTGTQRLLLGGSFPDPQRGWIVGAHATILLTVDGGATWNEAVSTVRARRASARGLPPRLNAVAFVDAERGWMVGTGGCIFATTNGGRTWQQQQSNVAADLLDVKFVNASEGWAVGTNGTIIHTANGGTEWRTEESGTTLTLERLFFVSPQRGWAVGFGGMILTRIAGAAEQKPPALKGAMSLQD